MIYALARGFCAVLLRSIWRMRVFGAQRLPASGPLIVVSNHLSFFDPPAVGVATRRPLFFMAKEELFSVPFLGPLMPHLNAFPIDRSRGDVSAIRRSLDILKRGDALLIFPEGGRNRDGVHKPQLGAALLVARSGAPVVPVYVGGTLNPRSLSRVEVTFGEPIYFDTQKKATRDDLTKWTQTIMQSISALSARSDRGAA